MPEIQNTFLQSKMNQDVDDRLLPNGEYRAAVNVAISRSEGSDVGALENILGNSLIAVTNLNIPNLDIIGYYVDSFQDNIYLFLTDYVDSSSNGISNFAPSTVNNFIYRYNNISGLYVRLVEGSYLNFSKNSPILGVNILEGLLFWTDNRNQPRRINVTTAASNSAYYSNEDKVSVAKYYPYTPISLIDLAGENFEVSTMSNPSQEFLDIEKGGTTYLNPEYDNEWAGDPELLSDKFVRFSYRFKFDDGEYSLSAPWTQICFIPKQQGYLNTEDAAAAYRSTIVTFMENNVAQMLLNITFPTTNPIADLNIASVDILYKESDGLSQKVIETIPATTVYAQMQSNVDNFVYSYKYISTKPYKTLPSSENTRIYDTVPVRALAQEVISNRIVYGNFFDKQTPPDFINYGVGYGFKDDVVVPVDKVYSQIEYPSSSVKQNRNYQVGFILADRFGRQSSVILSARDSQVTSGNIAFGGSTIYLPYADASINALDFPGYELKVLVDVIEGGVAAIPTAPNLNTGYPGVYKDTLRGIDSATIDQSGTSYVAGINISTTGGTGTGCTVNTTVNVLGEITSVNINNPGAGYRTGDILVPVSAVGVGGSFSVVVNEPNLLGWYSYKIVVKQTEQEYYNVYLPGILNGYPYGATQNETGTTEELNQTANIVLFSDNINKVPRDLSEVGPDQRQYRSSITLFGRVTPYISAGLTQENTFSTQYYPTALSDSIPSIATLRDTNYVADVNTPGSANDLSYIEFYQSDTNPSIARISTGSGIGKRSTLDPATAGNEYGDALGVYETGAVTSLLDIYWETSSVGLIKDLNKAIAVGFGGPAGITLDSPYTHTEGTPDGTILTTGKAVDAQGASFATNQITYSLMSAVDGNGNSISQWTFNSETRSNIACYELVSGTDGFTLAISSDTFFYYSLIDSQNNYTFTVKCADIAAGTETFLEFTGSLSNTAPEITAVLGPITYVLGSGLIADMQGLNGMFNGDNATRNQGLEWAIGDVNKAGTGIDTSGQNYGFAIDSVNGFISNTSIFIAGGDSFTVPVILTDSGPAIDTIDLIINISSTQQLEFNSYNKNSSGLNPPTPLPYLYKISYEWEDEVAEQVVLFPESPATVVQSSQNATSLPTNVSPYPNAELKAKWRILNENTGNDTNVYVYKGDPGINYVPGNTLPSGVELIGGSGGAIPASPNIFEGSYTITSAEQQGASAFTTIIVFDEV